MNAKLYKYPKNNSQQLLNAEFMGKVFVKIQFYISHKN